MTISKTFRYYDLLTDDVLKWRYYATVQTGSTENTATYSTALLRV